MNNMEKERKDEFPESSEWLHGGWMSTVFSCLGLAIGGVLAVCLVIKWVL